MVALKNPESLIIIHGRLCPFEKKAKLMIMSPTQRLIAGVMFR